MSSRHRACSLWTQRKGVLAGSVGHRRLLVAAGLISGLLWGTGIAGCGGAPATPPASETPEPGLTPTPAGGTPGQSPNPGQSTPTSAPIQTPAQTPERTPAASPTSAADPSPTSPPTAPPEGTPSPTPPSATSIPTAAPTVTPAVTPAVTPVPTPQPTPQPTPCPPLDPSDTLEALSIRFEQHVYPLMLRQEGGCTACHGPDSGRMMTMGGSGSETFYRLRAGGFLRDDRPGTLLDRLSATDDSAMPQGGPPWTPSELETLACVAAQQTAFDDATSQAPDEVFPPELLDPYTGPPSTEYDTTWLTYEQLKGRITVQFGDAWIRDGVDQFSAHIALLGGVDFETTFVQNRTPTADYLLALDTLAEDVCSLAVEEGSGPFAGLDVTAPVEEEVASSTTTWQAEAFDDAGPPFSTSTTCVFNSGPGVVVCSNGGLLIPYSAPQEGSYRISTLAKGQEAGTELPILKILVDGLEAARFNVPATGWKEYAVTVSLSEGSHELAFLFANDYYAPDVGQDRNLYLDWMAAEGPQAGTTPGAAGALTATRARLGLLGERILLRTLGTEGEGDEVAPLYDLLLELEALDGNRLGAWAGVCEGLLKHPDFIFTRAPSFDTALEPERQRLLLVKTALDLLNRPPTEDEFFRFEQGTSRLALIREWLDSEEFRTAWFHWLRLRLESDGTATADEPAYLWLYLQLNPVPLQELLLASYTVGPAAGTSPEALELVPLSRSDVHGPTGVLTMPGYILHKPGLPHYNFAARVLQDFMGYIFEVPSSIVDMRAGSPPSSTVEEGSVCYSCHYLLTPLAYQRSRWDDWGDYHEVDEAGNPIDDSDQGMVAAYPFKGAGMAAFAAQATRKEMFIRTMSQAQFLPLFGRTLRYDTDERTLYQSLWDAAGQGQGTFRDMLEVILESYSYTDPVGSRPEN